MRSVICIFAFSSVPILEYDDICISSCMTKYTLGGWYKGGYKRRKIFVLAFKVVSTGRELFRDPGGAPDQAVSLTAECSVPEQVWKRCAQCRVLAQDKSHCRARGSSSSTRDVKVLNSDSVLGILRSSVCSRGSVALHPTTPEPSNFIHSHATFNRLVRITRTWIRGAWSDR